ncbi:hypothetical protein MPTK1_3g10330 [Marchantia polymorpha subsp. ruderalis]|uniref:Phytocyanin domain-containing protein n=2 Tax=Marchantia polymorpha TaxID=3197 RepID=A0AAF6AZC0_MARPO|nr:hypothetical protein MARPO_0203s0014 [Marchantia polymorpha]BBN05104.1 hypothetical protein Mp_3g10330 [Marchantia polymorpha subsp. ruderalis]|eukprot:PTQ27365.1 hypothetical protein MARPO_0203s0014 [Marchantia polymorpha]
MAGAQGKLITIMVLASMLQIASAVTYTVGDAVGWTFVESATFYDDWAKTHTFRVGDELDFVYSFPAHDVFQVSETDVASCTNATTIQKWEFSNAKVTLNSVGYHGYICSLPSHCSPGNMKMSLQVVAADDTVSEQSADAPAVPPTAGDTPGNSGFTLQSGSALMFGTVAAALVALLN